MDIGTGAWVFWSAFGWLLAVAGAVLLGVAIGRSASRKMGLAMLAVLLALSLLIGLLAALGLRLTWGA